MSRSFISAFKVSFSEKEIADFLHRAGKTLVQGSLIPGKNNTELEELFAKFTNMKYAVAVNSGSAALEIIMRSLGLEDKEVLIPANTNYATLESAIRAGVLPILYDSDLYPDFESIEKKITKKTKALVVVHIGGYITPDIEKIRELCKVNHLLLIEDASHAHGSKYGGRSVGSFGIASAFSMFATKVITTSEGGIIITNNKKIRDVSYLYRDQGKDKSGVKNIVFGGSWRMSELHAALGIAQMQNLNDYLERNNKIATYYKTNLTRGKVYVPFDTKAYYSGYKFIILLPNRAQRNSLKNHLLKNNIRPGKGVYEIPLHLQPVFSKLNLGRFPKAERFAETHLCLPIWKGMTNAEVKMVVDIVNKWSSINKNTSGVIEN